MLLRKKIYQFSLAAFVFACGSLFAVSAALAQTPIDYLVVDFNPDILFEVDNFLPGDSESGSAYVENNNEGVGEKTIAIEAINVDNDIIYTATGERFGDALDLTIEEDSVLPLIFEGTLTEFFDAGEFVLSNLSNGANTTYNFLVTFRELVDEEYYQGKSLGFDVIIGFQGEGGGVGTGALPSGLTILNESILVTDITEYSATVLWTTSYLSTSQVIYAADGETYEFDLSETNYGYPHAAPDPEDSIKVTAHAVTITGLQENTTYYFRCISHASPPTISRSRSFTTLAMTDNIDNNTTGSTQEYGTNSDSSQDGNNTTRESGTNDSASVNHNTIVSNTINSIDNFIGLVLGNTDITDGDTVNSGAELENKAKGSFKSNYDQVLLSLIVLFLLVIVLLSHVYKFRIKKKKYIGDKDDVS